MLKHTNFLTSISINLFWCHKIVCLYECTDDEEYFSETLTEKKKDFYTLNMEDITDADYTQWKKHKFRWILWFVCSKWYIIASWCTILSYGITKPFHAVFTSVYIMLIFYTMKCQYWRHWISAGNILTIFQDCFYIHLFF